MIKNLFYKSAPALAIRYRKVIRYSFENEIRIVRDYLKRRSGLFVDIGAHLGTWSFWIASRKQHVVAFEPNPTLVDILQRSRIPNTRILGFALGPVDGKAVLKVPFRDGLPRPGNGTITGFRIEAHQQVLEIPVRQCKLDDMNLGHIAAIKIDCEGGEEGVLEGAINVIRIDMPLIVLEIHQDRSQDLARVSKQLGALGYSAYWVEGNRPIPLSTKPRPESCDNLLFIPMTDGQDRISRLPNVRT